MRRALLAAAIGLVLSATSVTTALAAEQTKLCGRVSAYTRPTATADGAVTIGSRPAVIRAGVSPSTDPQPNATMCVRGETDAFGGFTSLNVTPLIPPHTSCGTVVSFQAATASATGQVVQLEDQVRYTLTIPAGVQLPPAAASGYQCFNQDLTTQGNLVISGLQPLPAGFRTPVPSTGPSVGSLPSTSVAVTTASVSATVEPGSGSGADQLLPLALVALLAVAVLIAPLALRRSS